MVIVKSTSRSICMRGYEYLGHALFKSVKLTHTLHFPFFLCSRTTLASQSGWCTLVDEVGVLELVDLGYYDLALFGLVVSLTLDNWSGS